MGEQEVNDRFIRWFSELKFNELPSAGILGVHLSALHQRHFPVPPGFIISPKVYRTFLENTKIRTHLLDKISAFEYADNEKRAQYSKEMQQLILNSKFPDNLLEAIQEAYEILNTDQTQQKGATATAMLILKNSYEPPFVAVRSTPSRTPENEHEPPVYLNIKGIVDLTNAIKNCYSALYTVKSLEDFISSGKQTELPTTAIFIQNMVQADRSATIHRNARKDEWIIEACWGLGNGISDGISIPDRYRVGKEHDLLTVLEVHIANKQRAYTRDSSGNNRMINLTSDLSSEQVLNAPEMLSIAKYAEQIKHIFDEPQKISFSISSEGTSILSSKPFYPKVEEKEVEQSIQEEISPDLETPELEKPEIEEVIENPLLGSPYILAHNAKHHSNLQNPMNLPQDTDQDTVHIKISSPEYADKQHLLEELSLISSFLNKTKKKGVIMIPDLTDLRVLNSLRNLSNESMQEHSEFGSIITLPAGIHLAKDFLNSGLKEIIVDEHALTASLLNKPIEQEIKEPHMATDSAIHYLSSQCAKHNSPIYLIPSPHHNLVHSIRRMHAHKLSGLIANPEDLALISMILSANHEYTRYHKKHIRNELRSQEDIEIQILKELS